MSIQIQRNGTWQEVSKQEFLGLVSAGVIRPDTAVIINDQQVVAARLKGIVFPSQQVAVPPPVILQTVGAVPHSSPRATRTTNISAIIAGIAVVAVVGVACLALLLSKVSGGGSLENVIPLTLTAAERAEADPYIERYGRGAIVGYLENLERLLKNDEDKNTDYNLVLKYLKYFVSQGADVNVNEGSGFPLHYAVRLGNVNVVKFLVSQGADVNANDFCPPLHLASVVGNVEVVKFLVSKGADVNARDFGGRTPLDYAKERRNNMEVVEFLSRQR